MISCKAKASLIVSWKEQFKRIYKFPKVTLVMQCQYRGTSNHSLLLRLTPLLSATWHSPSASKILLPNSPLIFLILTKPVSPESIWQLYNAFLSLFLYPAFAYYNLSFQPRRVVALHFPTPW